MASPVTSEKIEKMRSGLEKWMENATPEQWAAKQEKARQTRENKRKFHQLARYMMEAEIPTEDDAREELAAHGFDQYDYQAAVFWSQLKKAINLADTEAAKYVRDTAGYKPTEAMQIGNLDDKPFETLDLSKLSNEELRQMIAKRTAKDEE